MTTPETKLLPTWEECEAASNAGTATPLQLFIYLEETAEPETKLFRERLIALLNSLTPHTWQESP